MAAARGLRELPVRAAYASRSSRPATRSWSRATFAGRRPLRRQPRTAARPAGAARREVSDLGILRDDREKLVARLAEAAQGQDLVLTSGGVSTGEADYVKDAIGAAGSLVFWRVGIKPGRPVAMGVLRGTAFVGLPGNPVAVFVTFARVVRPLLLRWPAHA